MSFPDDVPVLSDGVVTLRAHGLADVDAVLEQCTDLATQRWTTVPVPYTREHAEKFVRETVPAGWGESHWMFAVEAVDDEGEPRFCGTVELRDEGNRRAEIAFGAHPWARGRGIVEAGLRLMLDWGFHEQRLRTVIWWANAGNWASRRVVWKLGFSFDGTIERCLAQRGDLVDAWVGVLHVDDEQAPRGEWLAVPRLLGDRVVLRGFRESDAERVAQACDDERTAHWLWRLPHPYTLADGVDYIESRTEQLATAAGITWAVVDPSTDELLGAISAVDLKPHREAELGYWTHPEARGRGLMTQACALVVRHCLTSWDAGGLGLQRIFVGAAEGNAASIHVVEANGFTHVSRERRALRLRDGSLVDQLGYDLLAEELDV